MEILRIIPGNSHSRCYAKGAQSRASQDQGESASLLKGYPTKILVELFPCHNNRAKVVAQPLPMLAR